MAFKGWGCLSCGFALMAFTFPAISSVAAWWLSGEAKIGFAVGAVVFMLLALLSLLSASQMPDPSWFVVLLPFLAGVLYVFLPTLPIGIDDGVVLTGGALVSLGLAIKKDRSFPRWPVIPILGAGIYVIFGEFIPTAIDEVIVLTLLTVPVIAKLLAARGSGEGLQHSEPRTSLPAPRGHRAEENSVIDV